MIKNRRNFCFYVEYASERKRERNNYIIDLAVHRVLRVCLVDGIERKARSLRVFKLFQTCLDIFFGLYTNSAL